MIHQFVIISKKSPAQAGLQTIFSEGDQSPFDNEGAALNLTTFLAGTFSLAPVRGLRTTLALLLSTLKVPILGSWILEPFFIAFPKAPTKALRALLASLIDNPASAAMALINSFFVMVKQFLRLDLTFYLNTNLFFFNSLANFSSHFYTKCALFWLKDRFFYTNDLFQDKTPIPLNSCANQLYFPDKSGST